MATQSGASSSSPQRWRPAPQAAKEHEEEKEKDRKFDAATSSGPRPYQPRLGPSVKLRVPSVNKTASTGESEQASSTYTRRGADNAREATRGSQHDPPSSTKASSTATNSDAQRQAFERTSSQSRDSHSTMRTATARTDSSSNWPRSTSSIPPRRTEPTPPPSTDKAPRSQKATVESDVDEDSTDSEVEKDANRPPASTAHKPVSSKAVVDDTSSSKTAEEQPIPLEREHRPYSQPYVNERIALSPPSNTTPTSDGTRSTRQDMESNDRKTTQEVEEARERLRQMNLKEDDLRQKNEAAKQRERERRELEERQKREAAEQRERERLKEEERQRAEAHAREVQEQREREKQRQEMEARDRELAKQLQEAEQRERLRQMQEAEQRERLRKKQEDEQRERTRQSERMKKEHEEFARRAQEATRRCQERKRAEDAEKERERSRRATWDNSSGGTPYSGAGAGTSGFPGSPPPFGSFGSGFPASPASFSNAGSASTQKEWDKYDKAWTALRENPPQAPLRWRDIPWPMVAQPSKYEDLVKTSNLTKQAIANFVLSPTHSQNKSPKECIREALLIWHPDRFESRWLPKCVEKDREEIKSGVGFVVRCLNDLMSGDGAFGSPP